MLRLFNILINLFKCFTECNNTFITPKDTNTEKIHHSSTKMECSKVWGRLSAGLKYMLLLFVIYLYAKLAFTVSDVLYNEKAPTIYDAVKLYGVVLTCVLYSMTFVFYLGVPVAICNFLGLVLYNPFTEKLPDDATTNSTHFLCFRVVTRGLFPNLVKNVTERNLQTCQKFGLKNFKFEIVTDNQLNLTSAHNVRVVPSEYRTPNGTLFKARALNYCLTQNVNILSPDDWIVHLDEETLLTESVLCGIIEFVTKPGSNIGQGVITYGGSEIENWITTLLDGVRTAIDYGLFRFALQFLHRPLFGFKGSFIIVKMRIEADIGFDFGPTQSIAEDLRFALTAWDRGYTFDFVYGIMQEKSTFTLADFVKQRKRWLIGHFHVLWNNSLPWYTKIAVLPMHVGNLFLWMNVMNSVISLILPVPIMKWQLNLFLLLTTNILFLLFFGNYMSLSGRRYHPVVKVCLCFFSQLLLPVLGIMEAYAAVVGFNDRNNVCFEIVQKEKRPWGLIRKPQV